MRSAWLVLAPATLGWGLAGCGSTCEVSGPLDHDDPSMWLCREDVGDCADPTVVHWIRTDGGVDREAIPAADNPALACFVVYPTVDLRLGTGLHHQTAQIDRPRRWLKDAVHLLNTACEIHAPVYRQVTLGTYAGPATARKDRCMDAAYDDVESAFDAFLARIGDRPFAVVGHSQGAQHLTRLLDARIEEDTALRARLVAAWPLGWSVGAGTTADGTGAFDRLTVCDTPTATGCVLGYRSFLQGEPAPATGRFLAGDTQVCTHPAGIDDPDAEAPLRGFVARPDAAGIQAVPDGLDLADDDLVGWRDSLTATCVGPPAERALEVRWRRDADDRPFNQSALPGLDDNGTHVHDVQIGILDIAADLIRRTEAWTPPR